MILVCGFNVFADGIVFNLSFAKQKNNKNIVVRPIEPIMEVSGSLPLDITSYPATIEPGRFTVQYYLNDQKLYETTGVGDQNGNVSFKYVFDSTQYANGRYKLAVNLWDSKGPTGIAVKDVLINNK